MENNMKSPVAVATSPGKEKSIPSFFAASDAINAIQNECTTASVGDAIPHLEFWLADVPNFLCDVAEIMGLDAVQANHGVFLIGLPRIWAALRDPLGRKDIENGWHRIRLPSTDGRARPEDQSAACILISPDEAAILYQLKSDPGKQRRVELMEMVHILADLAKEQERFKEDAAERHAGVGRKAATGCQDANEKVSNGVF